MQAKDVMTREVISIEPEASILQAVRLMLQHKISGLPVIDGTGWCSPAFAFTRMRWWWCVEYRHSTTSKRSGRSGQSVAVTSEHMSNAASGASRRWRATSSRRATGTMIVQSPTQ